MASKRLTAIDLFSGVGGLTLGLRNAGFDVVAAVEIDSLAAEAYKANHGDVRLFTADIRELDPCRIASELGITQGDLDLIAGCPPCQGFSSIRTLNGSHDVSDARNGLLADYVRFVRELRPRAILMENVPGMAKDPGFAAALNDLERLGYPVKEGFEILNAADYGVAQRRKRLVLLSAAGSAIEFPSPEPKHTTVREAIGNLPLAGDSGDPLHDLPEKRSEAIQQLIESIPKDGGSRNEIRSGHKLPCHKSFDGFSDVYGRMRWEAVSPTITTGCFNPSKGRFLHPEHNRAMTMREAALLQGFPPQYSFPLTRGKTGVAELIGNALPPPFVEAHARKIREHLEAA